MIQIIEFLNLKSLNFFKFQTDIETNAAFLIVVKFESQICKISFHSNQFSQITKSVNKKR